ncbi:hypothetical protein SAMN05518683_108131 [Salibacterium halotolerans]|uniref:Uncharacterized protein n=1 Tax=Salibacterium halotolerans TaxID=1884432 RepID=A0A1I5SCG1_9BACI|nr:hypothetical protein SAMN05518683_108131 [Salibacterium halotolerans]
MGIILTSGEPTGAISINNAIRQLTGDQDEIQDSEGIPVCQTGFASGSAQCGTLSSTDVSYEISGSQFYGLRGTTMSTVGATVEEECIVVKLFMA